jgi:CRP/FNR family cyclic AMP-dependent transcriptional regulator
MIFFTSGCPSREVAAQSQPAMNDETRPDDSTISSVDLLALWMQNPIVAAAGEETGRALAAKYVPTTHPAGVDLIKEGETSDQVHVVLSGTVRIYQKAADGREVLAKLLRSPCLFGDLELLAEVPMVKNVASVDEVSVAVIPWEEYLDLLRGSSAAMMEHLKQIAAAFCVAARNQRQVFASLEQRMANLVLSYADFYGDPSGDDLVITEKLSQQQIALSLGTVRRSVAKVLSEWTKKGLLSRRDDRYVVHRMDKLEELAASIRGSLNYQMGMSMEQVAMKEQLSRGVIEVLSGSGSMVGRRYPIEGELLVGRQKTCHLVLPDDFVSIRHCRIYRGTTGPRFWIEDLESDNGTRVNGGEIARAVLREDDLIEVGSTRLCFRLEQLHEEVE